MIRKGYTLIEIVIIFAIISIVSSLAYPSKNFYRSIKEKREIDEFRKDILFARNKAIVESRHYIVHFYHTENGYEIKTGENNPAIKKKSFKYGTKLEVTNPVKSFTFNPNGSTTNSGTIYFRDSYNQRHKVTLTPATGRVTFSIDEDGGGRI